MKTNFDRKILRAALAVAFAGAAVIAQAATSGSTSATASVITPLTIGKVADLNFGRFAPGGAAGTVTVSTSGSRTASGAILSTIGSTPTAAKFDVGGDNNATFTINYSATTITLSDATPAPNTKTMTLNLASEAAATATNKTSGTATSGTLSASGAQSIFVGGTLDVGATQAAGTYTGSFTVTVQYN